jgi:hypothetical protein
MVGLLFFLLRLLLSPFRPIRLEAENAALRRQLARDAGDGIVRVSGAIGAGNPGTWEVGRRSMLVYRR